MSQYTCADIFDRKYECHSYNCNISISSTVMIKLLKKNWYRQNFVISCYIQCVIENIEQIIESILLPVTNCNIYYCSVTCYRYKFCSILMNESLLFELNKNRLSRATTNNERVYWWKCTCKQYCCGMLLFAPLIQYLVILHYSYYM